MTILPVLIRPERLADHGAIGQVTMQAFATHPHSRQTEHCIIDALRRADALSLSLVAEWDGQVVGHVAFSPVAITDGSRRWYILGPVSVRPDLQKKGIGRQLIETGLAQLRLTQAAGCVLVGEPAYYSRFGFMNHPQLVLPGVPQMYVLALPFGPSIPQGQITPHDAFNATS